MICQETHSHDWKAEERNVLPSVSFVSSILTFVPHIRHIYLCIALHSLVYAKQMIMAF